MAPDRRLIPPSDEEDDVASSSSSRVRRSANVVGVVPQRVHGLLLAGGGGGDDEPGPGGDESRAPAAPAGRVDDRGSGLSYLLGRGSKSNEVAVWEHSTQTLGESLVQPPGPIATLVHPEHGTNDVDGGDYVGADGGELLAACLGPDASSDVRRPRTPGRTSPHPRRAYAASPSSGVVCAWILGAHPQRATHRATRRGGRGGAAADGPEVVPGGGDPDASIRLRLAPGEVLTDLVPVGGGGGAGGGGGGGGGPFASWLLASTSRGRVWKVCETSRPPALHAKLVRGRYLAEEEEETEAEGSGGGLVRGIYDYLTTPSKRPASARDDGEGGGEDEEEDIAALIALPSLPVEDGAGGGAEGGAAAGRSPGRGPPGRPAPRKQQRVASSTPDASDVARFVSLSSDLVATEWRASLVLGGIEDEEFRDGGGGAEGRLSRAELFPRRPDGTLDLSSLCGESEPEGYRRVDLLASPRPARDGKSFVIVVRIDRGGGGDDVDDGDEDVDPDATRAYVLRVGVDRDGPRVVDAAWLDRHPGRSLSRGGWLECAGLAVAEGEGDGVAVAYVAFGPRGGGGEGGRGSVPVTVSAVRFGSNVPPVRDVDLDVRIVPSVVKGSTSFDALSGGCVLLASSGLLAGVVVRFPSLFGAGSAPSEASRAGGDILPLHDEAARALESHLLSSFRQYRVALEGGEVPDAAARGAVPPSVAATRDARILSAAAVLASESLARGGGGGGVAGGAGGGGGGAGPAAILRRELRAHRDFVTFLAHAGAYRRIAEAGRARMRDHGEMLTAARALLDTCQSFFAKADAAVVGDAGRLRELMRVRRLVADIVEGASADALDLPRVWTRLQRLSRDDESLGTRLLLLTSSAVWEGVGRALRYREDESGPLYDLPSHLATTTTRGGGPWTASPEVLDVLDAQLRSISTLGEAVLSASEDRDADRADLRRYVEDLSATALSGRRDAVLLGSGNEEASKSYEETKSLSIPLLRHYAEDDGDDLVALQTSLDHSYFEGIVQICHDHQDSWRFQGPFSDEEADERYDLRAMVSANASSQSPYAHLHQTRDYWSGLPFCGYVFRWYADRGMYPEVFELGKDCPYDLMRYVAKDDRMSDLAWIQHLRVGGHGPATAGLLGLTSPLLFREKEGGAMGLLEKDVTMSIAKLSNKLAGAKFPASRDERRNEMIENSLTLISAQKMLQKDTEMGDEIALNADDLLRLACEKIQSAETVEDMKRFGIYGLVIAAAKPREQAEAMARDASIIWLELIQADINIWKCVSNENSVAIGGMLEEELIQRVEGTAFVAAMYDFVASIPGRQMDNVGFTSNAVRNNVFNALGSTAFAKVLALSADIAADVNN